METLEILRGVIYVITSTLAVIMAGIFLRRASGTFAAVRRWMAALSASLSAFFMMRGVILLSRHTIEDDTGVIMTIISGFLIISILGLLWNSANE